MPTGFIYFYVQQTNISTTNIFLAVVLLRGTHKFIMHNVISFILKICYIPKMIRKYIIIIESKQIYNLSLYLDELKLDLEEYRCKLREYFLFFEPKKV